MLFEWDDAKRSRNLDKHGIDFADVGEVFESPMLFRLDQRADHGEERWVGVGLLRQIVVVLVFVERQRPERIRLISVRKATRHEARQFQQRLRD